jgi:5-methylthioribose kinase
MNPSLGKRAEELGRQYLKTGDTLLHGDFYPGSWLLTSGGPYVIDPEFCYAGDAEFDWGILLGHLKMVGAEEADCGLKRLIGPASIELDWNLVQEYAAVEILRRILGVAQLPISMNLEQRLQLAEQAADILLP